MKMHDLSVGVCSRSFGRNQYLRQHLEQNFLQVIYHDGKSTLKDDLLIDFLHDKSIAILGLEKITSKVLDACPNLKIFCKMGTGTDKIDLDELKRRNIAFFNTPGFNKHAVAELVLALALVLIRRLPVNISHVKNQQWKQQLGNELRGKQLGLLGFGAIGQEVARVFSVLGCSVVAYDINPSVIEQTDGVDFVSKQALFSQSDIISIHVPLIESTQSCVDKDLIDSMKPKSLLINTSRGEVIDQSAMTARLLKGDIQAGLDVLHHEPSVDFSLAQLPNVIVTPHIGGSTHEAVKQNGITIIEFLKDSINNTVTM
jgi:phosphoglycerate dehydrogenase-like enzyme